MDEAEVVRMTTYFQDLELALRYYYELDINVDFENGNMFQFLFGEDKKTWNFGEAPLPFTSFQFGNLHITDEELLSDLAKVPKCDAVLEADDDPIVMLAEILIGFISQFGTPREVRVSNVIVEAGLEQICDVCGIKLRRVKRLQGLDEFMMGMQRFRL